MRVIRRHASRLVLVELSALALLLAALTSATAARATLIAAAAVCAVVAYGRRRQLPVSAWIAIGARWSLRRGSHAPSTLVADGVIIDADGAVGVFELGDSTMLVTTEETPLPRLDRWPALSQGGGPRVHLQVVVHDARGFLAVRACRAADGVSFDDASLRAALNAALRRASRHLHDEHIPHRRLENTDLEAATGVASPPREAWDHLTAGPTIQTTLRTSPHADRLDQNQLVRLTARPDVGTVVAWSGAGTTVTIRLIAASDRILTDAVAYVASVVPVRRLDGDHLSGWRMTLPLAVDGDGATTSGRATDRDSATNPDTTTSPDISTSPRTGTSRRPGTDPDTSIGSALTLPATGVVIGEDRTGRHLRIRMPASGRQVRVIVIGGPAAARRLAELAEPAGGVPLRVDVLDGADLQDAGALRAADVVICHPLTQQDAYAVADALDLSPTTAAWLSRIDRDMVAVIADGLVRWAMMPAPVGTDADVQGLAAFA